MMMAPLRLISTCVRGGNNGNVLSFYDIHNNHAKVIFYRFVLFLIGFDLNLPLDEFGAIDFDYV